MNYFGELYSEIKMFYDVIKNFTLLLENKVRDINENSLEM